MLPENWHTLSADEKFEARFDAWLSVENKEFTSHAAALTYQRRTKRYYDIIMLRQPDRVPCVLTIGGFAAKYADVSHGDFFYNYEKAIQALTKFYEDFDLDYQIAGGFMPGSVFDRLDYKLYSWPGGKLPENRPFQCDEKEYMLADEYDELIADPNAYMMRRFMPRVFGNLEALKMIPDFIGATELPFITPMMAPFGSPPLRETLQAFVEAGQAALEWLDAKGRIDAIIRLGKGLPGVSGGYSKAPFDFIGDTMRGTQGIMLDIYRQPEKIIEACSRLIPIAIRMAVNSANAGGTPIVMLPLHKGADGFMSEKDFKTLYWPSLKATILGIIEEGIVPCLFAEGGYNQRLDVIAESGLPTGKMIWYFDQTDMAAAKEKIGGWACIGGNIPASLFQAGTPRQMENAVKKLIDTAAPGGGYYIAPGASLDDADPANVHAYLKTAKEYGRY